MKKEFSFKKKIVFTLIIVLFFLIVLEGMARVVFLIRKEESTTLEPDTILDHRWKANIFSVTRLRGIEDTLITNSQHWVENYDIAINKPLNVKRIFYLGDSNTQGVVSPSDKMVEKVEKLLNDEMPEQRFEVINTGTSSYSIMQYYLLSTKYLMKYSPDVVVINVDMTDVSNDFFYRKFAKFNKDSLPISIERSGEVILTPTGFAVIEKSSFTKFFESVRHYSKLIHLLHSVALRFGKNNTIKPEVILNEDANWMSLTYNDKIENNIHISMKLLGSCIEFLQSKNVKVVVTSVPHYPQFTGLASIRPHEYVKEVTEENKAYYLNTYLGLKDKVEAGKPDEYYFETDPTHFNVKGNKVWADLQFEFLKEKIFK